MTPPLPPDIPDDSGEDRYKISLSETGGTIHTLDARWLPPPEPMERTLEMLDAIGVEDKLVLLLHREPFPLYDILWRNGFIHRTERLDDASFAIHIRRRPS